MQSHWSMPINVKTLWQDVDGDDEEGAEVPDPFDEPNFHHYEHREQPRQPPDQVWLGSSPASLTSPTSHPPHLPSSTFLLVHPTFRLGHFPTTLKPQTTPPPHITLLQNLITLIY